jgi:hypothetical protein
MPGLEEQAPAFAGLTSALNRSVALRLPGEDEAVTPFVAPTPPGSPRRRAFAFLDPAFAGAPDEAGLW